MSEYFPRITDREIALGKLGSDGWYEGMERCGMYDVVIEQGVGTMPTLIRHYLNREYPGALEHAMESYTANREMVHTIQFPHGKRFLMESHYTSDPDTPCYVEITDKDQEHGLYFDARYGWMYETQPVSAEWEHMGKSSDWDCTLRQTQSGLDVYYTDTTPHIGGIRVCRMKVRNPFHPSVYDSYRELMKTTFSRWYVETARARELERPHGKGYEAAAAVADAYFPPMQLEYYPVNGYTSA